MSLLQFILIAIVHSSHWSGFKFKSNFKSGNLVGNDSIVIFGNNKLLYYDEYESEEDFKNMRVIDFEPDPGDKASCTRTYGSDPNCENYLKDGIIHNDLTLICGTNAMAPQCCILNIPKLRNGSQKKECFSGNGLVGYRNDQQSLITLVDEESTENNLMTIISIAPTRTSTEFRIVKQQLEYEQVGQEGEGKWRKSTKLETMEDTFGKQVTLVNYFKHSGRCSDSVENGNGCRNFIFYFDQDSLKSSMMAICQNDVGIIRGNSGHKSWISAIETTFQCCHQGKCYDQLLDMFKDENNYIYALYTSTEKEPVHVLCGISEDEIDKILDAGGYEGADDDINFSICSEMTSNRRMPNYLFNHVPLKSNAKINAEFITVLLSKPRIIAGINVNGTHVIVTSSPDTGKIEKGYLDEKRNYHRLFYYQVEELIDLKIRHSDQIYIFTSRSPPTIQVKKLTNCGEYSRSYENCQSCLAVGDPQCLWAESQCMTIYGIDGISDYESCPTLEPAHINSDYDEHGSNLGIILKNHLKDGLHENNKVEWFYGNDPTPISDKNEKYFSKTVKDETMLILIGNVTDGEYRMQLSLNDMPIDSAIFDVKKLKPTAVSTTSPTTSPATTSSTTAAATRSLSSTTSKEMTTSKETSVRPKPLSTSTNNTAQPSVATQPSNSTPTSNPGPQTDHPNTNFLTSSTPGTLTVTFAVGFLLVLLILVIHCCNPTLCPCKKRSAQPSSYQSRSSSQRSYYSVKVCPDSPRRTRRSRDRNNGNQPNDNGDSKPYMSKEASRSTQSIRLNEKSLKKNIDFRQSAGGDYFQSQCFTSNIQQLSTFKKPMNETSVHADNDVAPLVYSGADSCSPGTEHYTNQMCHKNRKHSKHQNNINNKTDR